MKFTLAQLRKLNFPYTYTEELDLNNELVGVEDILKVQSVKVVSTIKEISVSKYEISFHIVANLVLECAVSLQEVPYQLETDAIECFSTNIDDEDSFIIDGQTLDTKEAIITNILVAKPAKVYA